MNGPTVWRTATGERIELPGGAGTVPVAINDRGVIVGNQFDALGGSRPVYWTSAASEPRPFGEPDPSFGAVELNESGLVVGTTRASDGRLVAAAYQLP